MSERDYFNFQLEPGKELYNRRLNFNKNDKPLVSIFTAYYNSKEYINQTANSVFNQTFPYWEWIIVNDGSTESGTFELLNDLATKDSRIKVYHTENQGRIKARDYAISKTNANILYMLDSDDLMDPTLLECGYWTLQTNPSASWAYTNCVNFGNMEFLYSPFFSSEDEKKENLIIGSSFIKKDALLSAGGYGRVDERVHEDWHLWLRMLEQGHYPVRMNYYGFWYRKRVGSVLNNFNINKKKNAYAEGKIFEQSNKIKNYINAIQYPVSTEDAYKSYPCSFEWNKEPMFDKSKKNILLILPWFVFGGADKFNLDLVSRLDKNKYNIIIVTTEPSEYIWRQKFEQYATVFDLSTFLHRKNWAGFIHYLIKSRNIDLVMVSNSYYGYYAIPWLKAEFPNVIFTDYIHAHDWSWRNGAYPRDSIAIYNFLDKTYTCNNFVKNVMIQDMKRKDDKIETVYIGIDNKQFSPSVIIENVSENILNLINGKKVILYICRIVELKRPIFMLYVLKKILEKDNNFILLVVGDGEQLEEMKKFCNKLGLKNNVIFCGMQTDTAKYYKLANVSVICSLTEGLAITAYESLAMGVPVVTSDVGGQSELINNVCGRVIKTYQDVTKDLFNRNYSSDEINEYANAIIELVSMDREKISHECITRIEKDFSVENAIRKLDNSFTDMINSGTSVNIEMLKNKEFFAQYLVLYEDIDKRKYNVPVGGITTKKNVQRLRNLTEEKLWSNPLYRGMYKLCKNLGLLDPLRKLFGRSK